MKILIAASDVANTITNLAKGFNRIGVEAHTFCMVNNPLYSNAYTYYFADMARHCSLVASTGGRVKCRPSATFIRFVSNYDIFIFVASSSLLPRMVDLPLLKAMGKTIIALNCGTDVRDYDLAKTFWAAHGRHYPYYDKDISEVHANIREERDVLPLGRYDPTLASKLHNTRMGEFYADAITSSPPSQTLGIRPYMQSGPICDFKQCTFHVPRRKRPVILHAPSSTLYKQTDIILNALKELQAEGIEFDIDYVNRVSHEEVLQRLTNADILIDQLCGAGVLAYEGMASGCMVLGGHTGQETPQPFNRPIYMITKENIKERVTQAVTDMRLRVEMAEKGRVFVENGYGSPESIAAYLLNAVQRAKTGDCDVYPTLFTQQAHSLTDKRVPLYLKELTMGILRRHGAASASALPYLAKAGHLPPGQDPTEDIPVWDATRLIPVGPYVTLGVGATYGN